MNLTVSFLFAALLAIVLIAWAKGFAFRTPRKHRHFSTVAELPLSARLRFAFARLIASYLPAPRCTLLLANFNSAEHLEGKVTYTADNVFTNAGQQAGRFLVAKQGTDATHIDLCGAADEPLGICTDAPAAADTGSVSLFGAAKGTQRGIASAAITAGADVYTAASGLLQPEPTVAGTYWLVGRAITAATGANDDFEFAPGKPVKVVVIAAPTQTSAATIAGLNSTAVNPTKADFDALLAEAGKLQADYYALRAAIHTQAALVKYL